MAFPRGVLRKNTREAFFAELLALVLAEGPQAVVVGLPLHADGAESLTTREARNFAASLKRRLTPLMDIPLYFMEEELSTYEAEEQLRAAGRRIKSGDLDQQAAVRILESFLAQPQARRKPV